MNEENIVQLPTLLERLAEKLRNYLKRDAQNREEWISVKEGICLALSEARGQFPADIQFGQWCEDNGFGQAVLNHQDRAAAINMGREPEALRKCLEATTRRSLQLIYDKDFGRFTSASKPPSRRKKAGHPSDRPPSREFEKAKAAFEELEEQGELITERSVAERAGVSSTPVRRVFAFKQAEAEANPLTRAEMQAATLRRYESAVRKAQREARDEVRQEVYAQMDAVLRHHREDIARAHRILEGHKGVMSKDTFRKIKACLHPDHNTFKFAAEALQAFSEAEAVLVKPDVPVHNYTGDARLPETVAELMARRRTRAGS